MRKAEISTAASLLGKKGGRKTAKKLRRSNTRAQIAEKMRTVANARWHPLSASTSQEKEAVER